MNYKHLFNLIVRFSWFIYFILFYFIYFVWLRAEIKDIYINWASRIDPQTMKIMNRFYSSKSTLHCQSIKVVHWRYYPSIHYYVIIVVVFIIVVIIRLTLNDGACSPLKQIVWALSCCWRNLAPWIQVSWVFMCRPRFDPTSKWNCILRGLVNVGSGSTGSNSVLSRSVRLSLLQTFIYKSWQPSTMWRSLSNLNRIELSWTSIQMLSSFFVYFSCFSKFTWCLPISCDQLRLSYRRHLHHLRRISICRTHHLFQKSSTANKQV